MASPTPLLVQLMDPLDIGTDGVVGVERELLLSLGVLDAVVVDDFAEATLVAPVTSAPTAPTLTARASIVASTASNAAPETAVQAVVGPTALSPTGLAFLHEAILAAPLASTPAASTLTAPASIVASTAADVVPVAPVLAVAKPTSFSPAFLAPLHDLEVDALQGDNLPVSQASSKRATSPERLRRRARRGAACDACRKGKRACEMNISLEQSNQACERCLKHHQQCTFLFKASRLKRRPYSYPSGDGLV